MLKPEDIRLSVERDLDGRYERIRAQLSLTYDARRLLETEPYLEKETRERIWNSVYGELSRAIDEAERQVMPTIGLGGYEQVRDAFCELRTMIANPFVG